ncbi:MAG: hypothetical protein C4576_36060 [Desulfobacteraceae bacterium]|nr:MAG: hypothetical protein C4576_36060 [Desulfobacteraceae bacterium]
MKSFVVRFLNRVSLLVGGWFIGFFAWWVSTGYFLLKGSRRRASMELYEVVFPGRSYLYHLYCTWRQFHSFAATYSDRVRLHSLPKAISSTKGRENLLELARIGKGGVIVMSHLGSYEIAATCFQGLGLKLLLFLGEREAKQVARDQREAMMAKGIHIHVSNGMDNASFGGLEALRFIREGGFVSLAGDLVWTDQRTRVPVRFFDREVGFTSAPHLIAMVAGAPLLTMFTYRAQNGVHRIEILPPREVKAPTRAERDLTIQASAQAYASALEGMIRKHPFQWYVFEPFFPSAVSKEEPHSCTCSRL